MTIEEFLTPYPEHIQKISMECRSFIFDHFPDILENIDLPAKMLAYGYGNAYIDLICIIIPSQKGVKLGFNRGVELKDSTGLLKGTGKISRHVEIKSTELFGNGNMKDLMLQALNLYKMKKN